MRKLSNRWKEKVKNGMDVQYLKYADITLTDGTVLNLTSANLWQNGMEFEDSVSNDSSFDIGSAIINVLNLSINNFDGEYSDYDFEGAEVICYVGLQIENEDTSELLDSAGEQILDSTGDTIIVHKNAVIEKTRICTVTVIEQPEDETVTIDLTCEDNMRKFDRNYSDSKLKYPATRGQIVRDACEVCGVTLQTTSFDRDDYIVQNRPNDEALTFRQVLQWAAQIGCQWMRCDEYGRLCVKWYDTEKTDAQEIDTTYSFTPQHTDVIITGIQVTEYSDSSDEEPESYMAGTQGYVLAISDNKLIRKGDGQTVASMIAEKCVGMVFRPFESECPTDVALEAGDAITIEDRNGNLYSTYLTTTTLQPGAGQNIACNAKSAAKNSSTRYSQATQAFVAARNMVKQEKTEREKALEEFGKRIDSATGVYTTEEIQEDGSRIFYLHDKPTLAESKAIWKMTSEAWGVSTDGGQTWNGGMTVDGDTIVRILNAVGVNADWINAGAIMVKDSDGNILFSVDMDTKKVIISGDSVVIGGKTATKALSDNLQESKDYSDGKLADYADTVTGSLAGLQAQIDGQIESFFYDYEPSLQNKPASEWTSTEERKKHEGDLFYWKSTGYAYRFMQDGATWKWQMIQDNDISKALAQAEKAQDTADGKRRTFVIQPSPPYDIGDLWSQDGGDILTCVVARAKGSVYASSDWKKLNKYTDDTTANKALEAAALAKNMTLQLSNEMQTITADADGNIAVFPQVSTKATVMYGSSDITDDCSYTITKSDSITGSWSDATHIYNVTGLSADNGWIDIRATYLSNLSVTKRFTISKQKKGEDGKDGEPGRTYMVEPSCNVLKRGSDKTISPNFITFKAYYRDGKSATRVPYKGRFVVEETADGNTWNTIYTSSTDEDTVTHYLYSILTNGYGQTVASSNGSTIGIPRDVTNVRCKLYASGGTTTLMDMQSVAVVIDIDNLTQEQIVSILTNDGAWKGLYYSNGRLYVSLDALLGGTVTLGGKKNGNGYLKIKDASNAVKGLIDRSGYTVFTSYEENSKYMKYTGIQFSSDGIFPVDIKKFFDDEVDIEIENSENWGISWKDNSLNVYATEVSADTGTFGDLTVTNSASFAKSPKIENMEYTTSSNTICWDGRTGYKQLMLKSSSSKRYKDIGNNISEQEIEEWYNIEPTWAKYKKGYLVKGDENEGRYIPMFIAENVEAFFPEATRHQNGLVEDWNERIMIPAMFAMLKAQKKKIDQQEKLINKLCEKLNIE